MSAFTDGYRTGKTWPHSWRPCGPPRCTTDMCLVQSLEYIRDWLQGFDEAIARVKQIEESKTTQTQAD